MTFHQTIGGQRAFFLVRTLFQFTTFGTQVTHETPFSLFLASENILIVTLLVQLLVLVLSTEYLPKLMEEEERTDPVGDC